LNVSAQPAAEAARRGPLDLAICVIAFLFSLFFLEVTFVGDYTFPLLIGGACGLLAARLAFAVARGRSGWRSWAWRAFGVLAALEVAAQAPRYAWTVTHFMK
jgi:hypothetical protein